MSLLRPVGFVVVSGLSMMGALAACEESGDSNQGPAPTPIPKIDDPGCTVLLDEALRPDSGRNVAVTHQAWVESDAGASDAEAPDAEPVDASAPSDVADAAPPAIQLQPDRVRTVACREGTTFDVAAAPSGNLRVVATGIRGQLVEFTEGAQTRVALGALRPTFAQARLGTLPDGQPLLVGTPEAEGQLLVWQGEASAPVVPRGPIVLGALASNHAGSVLVSTSPDEALLRTSQGALDFVGVPATQFSRTTSVVGLGNDGRAFRVPAAASAVVELTTGPISVGGQGSVKSAAFTTLDAAITLPALALIREHGDAAQTSFEVAIPSGPASYARIEVLPSTDPCPAEPGCSNVCDEASLQVDPGELAMAWDGARAFVVFVRKIVHRTRSHRMDRNSGIECHLFDCDPYCTSSVQVSVTAAEIVVATLDAQRRTLDERYVLPLEVSASAVRSAHLPNEDLRLQASVRDGFLHVTRFGKYQGAFDALSTYRFRVAP